MTTAATTVPAKTLAAERQVSRVRLAVLGVGTIHLLAGSAQRDDSVWAVLALAWVYGLAAWWFEPHRHWPLLRSSEVTAFTDAIFSTVWIHLTGGVESPWYLLYYLGLPALAFRFGLRETIGGAALYATTYLLLLAWRGELAPNVEPIALRVAFIFLVAALCALLAAETIEQARGRDEMELLARAAGGAEAKLRGILQAARTPILMFDAKGTIEFANGQAKSLFESDLIGKTMEEVFKAFDPEDGPQHGPMSKTLVAARGGTWDHPHRVRRPDGQRRDVLLNVSAYAGPDGVTAGMIAVFYDITREKKREMEFRSTRLRVEEAERRRIARELHDEVGQILTGLKLALDMAGRREQSLSEARSLVNDLMARVRNLSLDLRPAMLDDLGLAPALLWLIERWTRQTGTEVDFRHGGLDDRRFSSEVETAAYRTVQEALTNCARHADARRVTVRVVAGADELTVSVEDDGKGFDPDAVKPGTSSGVVGMRERASLLGGTFQLESNFGAGTRLTAELPLGETST